LGTVGRANRAKRAAGADDQQTPTSDDLRERAERADREQDRLRRELERVERERDRLRRDNDRLKRQLEEACPY
jgi:chromosome segregation ATPase